VTKESDIGAGAPSRRRVSTIRPEGGPSPRRASPFRHLAHVPSFRDNPVIFFTTCTHQRCKILASLECEKVLREIWQRSAKHDGWWVGHYILMPDHVHLFARPELGARRMADWVEMWKSVSSRRIAAAFSIKSPIWQPEYFDRYLRSSENYSEKWHYVDQNAVRAGLVEAAELWPYRGTISDLMF
jgi:putative transposase